jgi:enoyl-[acyl-carrier protein] reductase I
MSVFSVSYGYLGPIKAALEHAVIYLAKSFSEFSRIRFNAVCAGPLKTSASAGIPGYVNNYLYAEKLTLRKEALKTPEVANTALFLLSPASSGINATGVKVDCGMSCNYFDQDIVNKVMD